MKTIPQALADLDTKNDDHWTDDGAPMVNAVAEALGRPVSRKDITNAAPKFTRENPELPELPDAKSAEPDPAPTQEGDDGEMDPFEREEVTDAKLADYDRRLEELKSEMDELQGEYNALQDERSEYVTREIEPFSHTSDQDARMRIIQRNAAERAKKAAKAREVLQGVDPSALDPRAPIDKALNARRQRGAQRPARPPMSQ